jgi:hypothetical protein
MYSEKKSETLVGIAYCLIKNCRQIGGGGGGGPLGLGPISKPKNPDWSGAETPINDSNSLSSVVIAPWQQ